jgi:hypothetical protein
MDVPSICPGMMFCVDGVPGKAVCVAVAIPTKAAPIAIAHGMLASWHMTTAIGTTAKDTTKELIPHT